MTKKKKLLIISSILFVILLFVFELISIKKTVHEENGVKIEMTVTKFLFFAHVNAKITNLSNKPLTYDGRNSCDDKMLKISGNDAFKKTYKQSKSGPMGCATVIVPGNLQFNESFQRKETFFKVGFSTEPIFIIASFEEQKLMGLESFDDKTPKNKEELFSIQTRIRFLQ